MANIIAAAEEDDVLVIADDGIFNDNLAGMLQTFNQKNAVVVALYQVKNLEEPKDAQP
jgi:dTDP-glucose pyrophosphorylase